MTDKLKILRLSEIRKRLANWRLVIVSRESGIPVHRIRAAIHGKNPKYHVIEKLSEYIERKESES